jgi:hypothetical protein
MPVLQKCLTEFDVDLHPILLVTNIHRFVYRVATGAAKVDAFRFHSLGRSKYGINRSLCRSTLDSSPRRLTVSPQPVASRTIQLHLQRNT